MNTPNGPSEAQIRIRQLAAKELMRSARRYLTLVDDYRDWAAENGPACLSTDRRAYIWDSVQEAERTARYAGTQRLNARLDNLAAKVNRYEQSTDSTRESRLKDLAQAQTTYLAAAFEEARAIGDGTVRAASNTSRTRSPSGSVPLSSAATSTNASRPKPPD